MTRRTLVMVHGRSQQGRDPAALKAHWLDTLRLGLGRARTGVLDDVDVVFPFYGDLLDGFVQALDASMPADILVRGPEVRVDQHYLEFEIEVAGLLKARLGLDDGQIDAFVQDEVRRRGPANWEWVQALLRAADAIPGVSAKAIEAVTRDVFVYLSRSRVRRAVNAVVEAAIPDAAIPGGRTVVIGHSLGSVVAYDVLSKATRPLDVALYLTVGSPLGVGPIRRVLEPVAHPAGVRAWYNAYDDRDVVALQPLDAAGFPVQPPIENYAGIRNRTENAHGISGYLNDPVVAGRIYDALR